MRLKCEPTEVEGNVKPDADTITADVDLDASIAAGEAEECDRAADIDEQTRLDGHRADGLCPSGRVDLECGSHRELQADISAEACVERERKSRDKSVAVDAERTVDVDAAKRSDLRACLGGHRQFVRAQRKLKLAVQRDDVRNVQ